MIELFVFRHGQTQWNVERRIQGHTDTPLNSLGLQQAKALQKRVEDLNIQAVLTSDLQRARITAEIGFEGLGVEIVPTRGLRETHCGHTEGMLISEIEKKYGKESFLTWMSHKNEDLDFKFPGGETKREHLARLLNAIETFVQSRGLKRVAVSTHGGSIKRLIQYASHGKVENFKIPNGELFYFTLAPWAYHGKYTSK